MLPSCVLDSGSFSHSGTAWYWIALALVSAATAILNAKRNRLFIWFESSMDGNRSHKVAKNSGSAGQQFRNINRLPGLPADACVNFGFDFVFAHRKNGVTGQVRVFEMFDERFLGFDAFTPELF